MLAVLLICISMTGCKKILDQKPNKKLVIPTNLSDLQAVLDNQSFMSEQQPNPGESSADDYFLNYGDFTGLDENLRNLYVWNKDNQFLPGGLNAWVSLYTQILYCNLVIDDMGKVERTTNDQQNYNTVKGHALFNRSRCFFQAAQIWSLAYDPRTAENSPGIPLRLSADFNQPNIRSTISDTYARIIADFKESAMLLPAVPIHVSRPSKAAAFGFLGRVYLSMNQNDSCLKYTSLALDIKNNLMDFNSNSAINPLAVYPFARFNPEVIYDLQSGSTSNLFLGNINKDLYNTYSSDDLRRSMFHRSPTNIGYYKGSYSGSSSLFIGIATDELYLMRAECLARQNNIEDAMKVLNALIITRWKKTVLYPTLVASDQQDALNKILAERRKELFFRDLRWMDIKRLNLIGAGIIIKRELNGQTYELVPNDKKYALAIPEDIINISGIQQNNR